jgi:hypothetical protein
MAVERVAEAAHLITARRQRRATIKGQKTMYIPQNHVLSDLFPPTSPPLTFYHFPIMPSYYESISGLIH